MGGKEEQKLAVEAVKAEPQLSREASNVLRAFPLLDFMASSLLKRPQGKLSQLPPAVNKLSQRK